MAFDIQRFRAQMQFDGARPNLFDCSLNFPAIIQGGQFASQKLTFMARAAQLPGSTVNSVPVMYFGRELKFAGNRNFADWTVTIMNDEDFVVRTAFERWMNGINSHTSNLRDDEFLQGDAGYQQDGFVTQYGKTATVGQNGILRKYRFVGMFPVDISPIELDWAQNDTIEEYSVTFAYQWWEDISAASGSEVVEGLITT